ncbi:ATP-binding protein [Bremerella cremea]|uniref:ATP-binding protein n=1 Tax=Bremerella cremea TaxID=1031537 RepID=UPI0031E5A129
MLTTDLEDGKQLHFLLGYVAELELEIDRLRRRDQFLQHAARDYIERTLVQCHNEDRKLSLARRLELIADGCSRLSELLYDITEPPGYHPAFDQVVVIPVRPLVDQIFRWQRRLSGVPKAVLRLELDREFIEWFPARFRQVIDNLVAHSLRHRNEENGEVRLGIELITRTDDYELRFTDNGQGFTDTMLDGNSRSTNQAAKTRSASLGGGLAVVKYMVEQCCGTVTVSRGDKHGSSVVVMLPRYGMDDRVEA